MCDFESKQTFDVTPYMTHIVMYGVNEVSSWQLYEVSSYNCAMYLYNHHLKTALRYLRGFFLMLLFPLPTFNCDI